MEGSFSFRQRAPFPRVLRAASSFINIRGSKTLAARVWREHAMGTYGSKHIGAKHMGQRHVESSRKTSHSVQSKKVTKNGG